MKKFLNILFVMCLGVAAQAQFSHTFTSSTSLNLVPSPYTSDPGCFVLYSGSSNVAWDNNAGGIKSPDNLFLVMLPYMNLQSGYSIKVTYTSNSSINFATNSISSGGSINSGFTYTSAPAAATPTEIVLSVASHISGLQRLYFFTHDNGPGDITVFSVEVVNATYSPGAGCTVTNGGVGACADADSDNVCDDVDDFPNDPNKAYKSVIPATVFMYEDLYPNYGDFDFNDLVVSAKRDIITDADNTLRFLVIEAEVKASGAAIEHGWGLELKGISTQDVVGVTGNNTDANVMTLGANGTESGQNHAVVPVFDNMNNVINRAGGAFFNTVPGNPSGTGDKVVVTIEFAKSSNLTINDLDYNFFSFRSNDRGHEIHEIGHTPTAKANMALFQTGMDDTDQNNGKIYVSVDGYPWAISSSGTDYVIEKEDIVQAFLKFAGWAQSGGNQYQDWHTNTTEGTYRNSAKIY